MRTEARSLPATLAWILALLIGLVLRVLPLTAARPYIAYVDEGNFLHPAAQLVREGGWDPKAYLYPQLPIMAVTAAARAVDPLYRLLRGTSLRDRIPAHVELYDDLEPFLLLFVARCLSALLGIALVVLTGLLAGRMGGAEAGAAAALLAAVTPALVVRSSIASVDSYAAFFVLACLYLIDVMRTSNKPGWTALGVGALAGAAFASKYPAVLVLLAFPATTAFLRIPVSEKLRRLGIAAVGLLIGAAAAMPALVTHPGEVIGAIRFQATAYGQIPSPSLASQAFGRAEWDIGYLAPELGAAFVLLALAGLFVGARDREIRPTILGWCAFAAASLLLYSRQVFQPFRNLLPLVPCACIAVALLFAWVRQRVRSLRLADALLLVWLLSAFAIPLFEHAMARHALVDSRTLAMNWLVEHARPEDRVLIVEDLGFLNQEVRRLGPRPIVQWWDSIEASAQALRPRFLVGGVLNRLTGEAVDVASSPAIRAAYRVRYCAGLVPTAASRSWWRGNHQLVCILERR